MREALEDWRKQQDILNGNTEAYDDEETLPPDHVSVTSAVKTFLEQVLATKMPGTYEAYRSDLNWFKETCESLDSREGHPRRDHPPAGPGSSALA